MPCKLGIKFLIAPRLHFWYLAILMIMKSLNSCTGLRKFTMEDQKRRDSHLSTARITYGLSSPQPSTKVKESKFSETSRISNSSYSLDQLILCGLFRNTWKSQCYIAVESLIFVSGLFSLGVTSSMFIARDTWEHRVTIIVFQIKTIMSISPITVFRNMVIITGSMRMEIPLDLKDFKIILMKSSVNLGSRLRSTSWQE